MRILEVAPKCIVPESMESHFQNRCIYWERPMRHGLASAEGQLNRVDLEAALFSLVEKRHGEMSRTDPFLRLGDLPCILLRHMKVHSTKCQSFPRD